MAAPSSLPSGWFPDPHGRHEHRWFNGHAWTADVSDDGQRYVDPLGAAPVGPAGRIGGLLPPRADPHLRGDGAGSDVAADGNASATASITCGLLAIATAWLPLGVLVGLPLGVLAVVFGVRGLRRSREVDSGRRFAVGGLIAGGSAIALSVVGIALTAVWAREYDEFRFPGPATAAVVDCNVTPGALVIDATVTNESARTRSYTVFAVVNEPSGIRDLVAEVDDLAAGATARFTIEASTLSATEECDVRLVVHGPRPSIFPRGRIND